MISKSKNHSLSNAVSLGKYNYNELQFNSSFVLKEMK